MAAALSDLSAFIAVVRAGGFHDGAHASGQSASSLSLLVRRLKAGLGVRLLNRPHPACASRPSVAANDVAVPELEGFTNETAPPVSLAAGALTSTPNDPMTVAGDGARQAGHVGSQHNFSGRVNTELMRSP